MAEVPCIFVEDLTEAQKRAYIIADNKLTEDAGWDDEILKIELQALQELDFDITLTGFELEDITIDEPTEIIEDEVPEIEEDAEPICKRGQVWKLGNHYLMCGDSTSKEDIETLLQAGEFPSIDLVITDPPYNVDYQGKTKSNLKIENDKMQSEEFKEFLISAFDNMYMAMKEGASFYVWYASRSHIEFETALNESGLTARQQLIWNKNSLVLSRQDYHWKHEPCFYGWKEGASHNWYNDRSQTTVLDFDRPTRNDLHPTMKPVSLIAYLIENSSKRGDKVLDLFGGSGSTLIASEQTGRQCYTMEYDPKYADVIIKRFENLTGMKAELVKER